METRFENSYHTHPTPPFFRLPTSHLRKSLESTLSYSIQKHAGFLTSSFWEEPSNLLHHKIHLWIFPPFRGDLGHLNFQTWWFGVGILSQAAFASPFSWVYTCQHRRSSVVWNSRNTPGLGTWNGHKRMAENWWQSWIVKLWESKNFRGSEWFPDEEVNDIEIKSFDWTKFRKLYFKVFGFVDLVKLPNNLVHWTWRNLGMVWVSQARGTGWRLAEISGRFHHPTFSSLPSV